MNNKKCEHCFNGNTRKMAQFANRHCGSGLVLGKYKDHITLWAECSDPYYTWGERVRFCPWCGRNLEEQIFRRGREG